MIHSEHRPSEELAFALTSPVDDKDAEEDEDWTWSYDKQRLSDNFGPIEALCVQLDLPRLTYGYGLGADPLNALLPELERVLRDGDKRQIGEISREAPRRAMSGWNLAQIHGLYTDFHWKDTVLGADVTVDALAGHLRAMAELRLQNAIAEMLNRWQRRGYFQLKERWRAAPRRQTSPAARQARLRERSEPRFVPPGRT